MYTLFLGYGFTIEDVWSDFENNGEDVGPYDPISDPPAMGLTPIGCPIKAPEYCCNLWLYT